MSIDYSSPWNYLVSTLFADIPRPLVPNSDSGLLPVCRAIARDQLAACQITWLTPAAMFWIHMLTAIEAKEKS